MFPTHTNFLANRIWFVFKGIAFQPAKEPPARDVDAQAQACLALAADCEVRIPNRGISSKWKSRSDET